MNEGKPGMRVENNTDKGLYEWKNKDNIPTLNRERR